MKTAIDLDAITIDGSKLREAREARNLSIAELAALVTLSREQIKAIEEGGHRPFYTPAHKLLALRKYANAVEVPYEDVVIGPSTEQTMPAHDDAPAPKYPPHEVDEPANIRIAAGERNAEIRRLVIVGAIAIPILLAMYAKVRGSKTEIDEEAADPAYATGAVADKVNVTPPPKTQQPIAKTKPPEGAETAKIAEEGSKCPPKTAASAPSVWSPAFQYKSDLRLFVISAKEGSVCVTDATGKESVVQLKPMTWQVIAGKPPYDVRSTQLAEQKLYLQGHLVRVPADTNAMRLIPTQVLPPAQAEAPAPSAAPAHSDTSASETPDA